MRTSTANNQQRKTKTQQPTHIHINIASIDIISEHNFGHFIACIPKNWHADILKYQKFDDKKRTLLARMMLCDLLDRVDPSNKKDMQYNRWGKPYIIGAPFFNWSHSEDHVVFAWSNTIEIGIDIEKKKEIDWRDFKTTFSKQQWSDIVHDNNPMSKFYYYWVINEAITKAKGMGLSFDVKRIELLNENKIVVDNEVFTLRPIDISPDYLCYLAFKHATPEIPICKEYKTTFK